MESLDVLRKTLFINYSIGNFEEARGKTFRWSRVLMIFFYTGTFIFLSLRPLKLYSQNTKPPIPDGTDGEYFPKPYDSLKDLSKKDKWENWNEFDGPLTTLKFGIGFIADYAGFHQDSASKEQVSGANNNVSVRDFRYTMSGIVKSEREITWKAGINYDGNAGTWRIRETGVQFKMPELSGYIFVGRTKEGYSMQKIQNGFTLWRFERPMIQDLVPILGDGIKYSGFFPKQRLQWTLGAYFNMFGNENQPQTTFKRQITTRLVWLPIYSAPNEPVLSIAFNYRYGRILGDSINVRSKPEVSKSPYFVETKNFRADVTNSISGEIYYRTGPFMAGTEFAAHYIHSPENGNPIFTGAFFFLLYSFTGDTRPYMPNFGIFTFQTVKRPVFKGGPGNIEATISLSNINLDNGAITGGKFWKIQPAIFWSLDSHYYTTVGYGFGVLNKDNLKGNTQFFQWRFGFWF
jgi:phosphate-selective porin OprO and OprP